MALAAIDAVASGLGGEPATRAWRCPTVAEGTLRGCWVRQVAGYPEEFRRARLVRSDEQGGEAHAFFVRYTKFQTIDQRREILQEANAARGAFRATLPPRIQKDRQEVARRMMKARIAEGQSYGKWADEWVEHPTPTMNEPHKAVSWLTAKASIDEDRMADMFLDAVLARIDNLFMKTRRLFQRVRAACWHLERPQRRLAWLLAVQTRAWSRST